MKGYVKRRLKGLIDPLEKPKLFSSKGYLSDLDSMIQTQYVGELKGYDRQEAMVRMLVELELKEKEK